MNRQEIFDTVYAKLTKQAACSVGNRYDRNNTFCAYRGDGGVKCAVGHLIPDSMYDPKMESAGNIRGLVSKFSEDLPYYFKDEVEFLYDLQRAHDTQQKNSVWDQDAFKIQMRKIAERYNLSTAVLEL